MTEAVDDIRPRGAVRIGLLVEKLAPLADYLSKFVPGCHWITLTPDDYDFICRWPKAARKAGFQIDAGAIMWNGFIMRAAVRQEAPTYTQTDIENRV